MLWAWREIMKNLLHYERYKVFCENSERCERKSVFFRHSGLSIFNLLWKCTHGTKRFVYIYFLLLLLFNAQFTITNNLLNWLNSWLCRIYINHEFSIYFSLFMYLQNFFFVSKHYFYDHSWVLATTDCCV